jgi:CubicO group peptidase (beta-lactamase class C family)
MATPDRFDAIREVIGAQRVERSIPSLAVTVVDDGGQIARAEGFGRADRERRAPAVANAARRGLCRARSCRR